MPKAASRAPIRTHVQVHHFKSAQSKTKPQNMGESTPKTRPSWRPEVGSLTRDELRAIVAAVVG